MMMQIMAVHATVINFAVPHYEGSCLQYPAVHDNHTKIQPDCVDLIFNID